LDELPWLSLYAAALEVEQRFGVSQAVARKKLRRACADEHIKSMKAPRDEPSMKARRDEPTIRLPFEYWEPVAPSEWREREVDYDGPDADGCKIEVMIYEPDFRFWIKGDISKSNRRAPRKRDLVERALNAIWPDGNIPESILNKEIERKVGELLKREGRDISRETILRAAGRK
jgi:hypothetical protein